MKLGFDGCLSACGWSGGLALLWKREESVKIHNYSQRHIFTWINDDFQQVPWLLTGYYGKPDSSKRSASWNFLKQLRPPEDIPWVVVGDFNEILHSEKKGVGQEGVMENFKDALEYCNLADLGHNGDSFTWSNRHSDCTFTKERLDRAVATLNRTQLFWDFWVGSLVARSFNH